MRSDAASDEATPLMPAALAPPLTRGHAGTPVAPPSAAAPHTMPAAAPTPAPRTAWHLVVAAAAASAAWGLLGIADVPRPPGAVAVAGPQAPPPPQVEALTPPAPTPSPEPSRRHSAPRRPAPPVPVAHASPPPSAPSAPIDRARARYLAGDLPGAGAAIAGSTGDAAAAFAARLDAVARLLGSGDRWPPPGGAAALERLLELDAAIAAPAAGPLAVRARGALAEHRARKGHGLADEGRWEEADAAFREALALDAAHVGAVAGLGRVEREAQARYLDAYASEDEDRAAARRLYQRAARLARPDGPLAMRIARALERLAGR